MVNQLEGSVPVTLTYPCIFFFIRLYKDFRMHIDGRKYIITYSHFISKRNENGRIK